MNDITHYVDLPKALRAKHLAKHFYYELPAQRYRYFMPQQVPGFSFYAHFIIDCAEKVTMRLPDVAKQKDILKHVKKNAREISELPQEAKRLLKEHLLD